MPRLPSSLGLPSCKSDSWRSYTCTNVLLLWERELGELVQPGGIWGLLWSLLCGVSGRKEVCIKDVIFMGFGQTGTKKCGGYLKFIN